MKTTIMMKRRRAAAKLRIAMGWNYKEVLRARRLVERRLVAMAKAIVAVDASSRRRVELARAAARSGRPVPITMAMQRAMERSAGATVEWAKAILAAHKLEALHPVVVRVPTWRKRR